jgi:hypothetical protein
MKIPRVDHLSGSAYSIACTQSSIPTFPCAWERSLVSYIHVISIGKTIGHRECKVPVWGMVAIWLPHIAPNLQPLLEFWLDCGLLGPLTDFRLGSVKIK